MLKYFEKVLRKYKLLRKFETVYLKIEKILKKFETTLQKLLEKFY